MMRCNPDTDVLFLIDLQDPFVSHLDRSESLLKRAKFLIRVARLLEVPVIATEQVPSRLGPTHPELKPYSGEAIAKDTFSSLGSPEVREQWKKLGRKNAILIGAETHICVTLTALDLLETGASVMVCPDAVSSRTPEAHKLGMERLRDSGAIPSHTESVVYEWLGSSRHPKFREVLELVKESG